MSQFGFMTIFDQPFMSFPLAMRHGEGNPGCLRLPCGTIPTALIEREAHQGTVTQVMVAVAGVAPLIWEVVGTADEVQETFAEGVRRLNKVAPALKAVSFDSELLPPDVP